VKVYPSLISSDLLNLRGVIEELDRHVDGYHIDVMDDHFVPNLTWGPAFVGAMRKATDRPFHLHLMVDNPEKWLNRVELYESDIFIFHKEVFSDDQASKQFLEKVKQTRCRVGIAINPQTPVESIFSFLSDLDHLLLMSVEPGFSGQKFIEDVLAKVVSLCEYRDKHSYKFSIGMDGGINLENLKLLAEAGVDEVGVASAIFSAPDPVAVIKEMRRFQDK